jgi:hypothetical protein
MRPKIADHLYMRTRKSKPKSNGTEMSNAAGRPSTDTLSRVIDLLVDHNIKLDALEHVLMETNPLVHERYLGTVETLRAQKAAELKKSTYSEDQVKAQ